MAAPIVIVLGLMLWVRSPYWSGSDTEVVQPVQFDHRHHVADIGIDCRYCHQSVEKSSSAGYPPTSTCLNCHSQVWNKSPLLDLVRKSYFTNTPIPWKRVHRLPDFVYFNHSIHVAKGIGCETCHGRVDEMPAITETGGQVTKIDGDAPLTMGWCLGCHRHPERFIRPKDQVTTMGYDPAKDPGAKRLLASYRGKHPDQKDATLADALMHANAVHTRTSCTTCHR